MSSRRLPPIELEAACLGSSCRQIRGPVRAAPWFRVSPLRPRVVEGPRAPWALLKEHQRHSGGPRPRDLVCPRRPPPHTITVGRRFQRRHFGGAHARPQQWTELQAGSTRGTRHLAVPHSCARQGWQSLPLGAEGLRLPVGGAPCSRQGGQRHHPEWGRLSGPPLSSSHKPQICAGHIPWGARPGRGEGTEADEAGAVRAGLTLGRRGQGALERGGNRV